MSTQIEEIWDLFFNGSARLACLGLAVTLLGCLAVRCRVSLRARIKATAATLMLLSAGGLLVMAAPFIDAPTMPVVAEVLESVDSFGGDIVWLS